MMCPAPGINHPTIGATIAMRVSGYSGAAAAAEFSVEVLAIQDDCHSDRHDLLLDFTSDLGATGPDQNIDFAAHAKLRQINTGLDGETRVGQDATFVMDFEIVHVGAVRVHLCADRMAGPVNEIVSVPSFLDVSPHRAVHFPSGNRTPGSHRIQYRFRSDVAALADDFENLALPVGGLAYCAGPGNVVEHCAGRVFLRPNVEQDKIAFANRHRVFGAGLVMWVTGVGVYSDDRWIVGDQIFLLEGVHEPLLDFVFVRATLAHAPPNFLKSFRGQPVDDVTRRIVSSDLVIVHRRLELGDQILRTYYIFSQAADQIYCSCVDQRNGKYQIVRRILHRDIAVRRQEPLHAVEQFLPPRVDAFGAGKSVQMTRFNLVNKFGRLAISRDQIEPTARHHEAGGQSENAVCDGIAMVMVVEEPGVDVALTQGLLDGFEVHGQRAILHDR